jgi:hypothetical protein
LLVEAVRVLVEALACLWKCGIPEMLIEAARVLLKAARLIYCKGT